MHQRPVSNPGYVQPPGSPSPMEAAPRPVYPPDRMGFSAEQLLVLREQIMRFRTIKEELRKRETEEAMATTGPQTVAPTMMYQGPNPGLQYNQMRSHPPVQTAYRPPAAAPYQGIQTFRPQMAPQRPMAQQVQYPRPLANAGLVSASRAHPQYTLSHQQAPPKPPQPYVAPYPSAADLLQGPAQVPLNTLKGPLFTTSMSRPQDASAASLKAMAPPNVPAMLKRELEYKVAQEMKTRISALEKLRDSADTCPGFVKVGEKLPRGSIQLALRKLQLISLQRQIRGQIEKEQNDINSMYDRLYRKFVRSCQSNFSTFDKVERPRQDTLLERVRDVKQWKTTQQERLVQERDTRAHRNKQILKWHERMSRTHHKAKDDDRTRRMDALKANDFGAYQELLRVQGGAETQGERYEVITKFLNETEEYLHKLASKVSSVKLQQEASEAYAKATAEARAMGFTDEEVMAAATQAAKDAAASSELQSTSFTDQGDAQSRYYSLAHSVEEGIKMQPAMLRGPGNAKLREYQMIGLQWMVSLYNNRLNGILADEMGLGKTVQVMALLAYLMENKSVYGPHLIIVPNAVIVNWKAELTQWLPDVRCVYYVGAKDERAKKYAAEVQSLQFNVLVTTYEFIMRDRAKLSKVDWKYIIIDEAQRMKDRQSKLAKDLDRFTASRRLLLTGTPLQNDLRELWSLLNLLLPEVFDDKSTFTEWFGESLGKATDSKAEDEWLETEKRVVVIHRLHQILEPFMLRRQVEDVESRLPPKVANVIKVAMSPYQSAIYNWVKETGTIRVDPTTHIAGKVFRAYAPLNNKCMELRKVCNHPALSYPPEFVMDGIDLVKQCGKFAVLDRMLVKLHAAGHRVLLFCTMTRLLDLIEIYLRWRQIGAEQKQMKYLRIDGSTSLEDREKAIQEFNKPHTDAFIFLLSIRAAGRGLNLQTADTVIIYDPDPNPKNEEQAIARSHRIGQTREVRVFHFEAVADADSSPAAVEATSKNPAGKKYADSIESLVRNTIQKTKIDMANEVIDAGRFNMATTQEERKETLEALLQDEERTKKAINRVPTQAEMNRMLARTTKEVDMFDKMDAQANWPIVPSDQTGIPHWLLPSDLERAEAVAANSKVKTAATAEMKAAAAERQAAGLKKRVRSRPGQYVEVDDSDLLEKDDDKGGPEISGSVEPSALMDEQDMEEEEIDGTLRGVVIKSEWPSANSLKSAKGGKRKSWPDVKTEPQIHVKDEQDNGHGDPDWQTVGKSENEHRKKKRRKEKLGQPVQEDTAPAQKKLKLTISFKGLKS